MKKFKIGMLSVLSLILTHTLNAQDRQFVRTYQSNTLAKGAVDIESWATFRTGRSYFYNRLDTRLEFETGLTDKLQSAFYFNASHMAFGPSKDTLGGIADTSMVGIFQESEFSVSSEWKLNLINSATHPFGFAAYVEFGIAPTQYEIETKLIFDKKTEKNMFALNLVNEYELKYEIDKDENKAGWATEDESEIDIAYMHMFRPSFGLGLEVVNSNEIEHGAWNFSALYAGPTIFYSGGKHFLILNFLPQLTNLHKTDDAPNNLVLNAREKMEVRLLWGFNF